MKDNKKVYALVSNKDETKIIHGTFDEVYSKKLFAWTSLSRRFETKEELIKDEGILDKPCKECGKIVSTSYIESTKKILIEKNICFNCYFWLEKIPIKDDLRIVRVKGTHYHIVEDKKKGESFLGHGGAEFNIQFNDGRFIVSHNLWCQGDIPERFKKRLPDNAEFIEINHPEREKLFNSLFPKEIKKI